MHLCLVIGIISIEYICLDNGFSFGIDIKGFFTDIETLMYFFAILHFSFGFFVADARAVLKNIKME